MYKAEMKYLLENKSRMIRDEFLLTLLMIATNSNKTHEEVATDYCMLRDNLRKGRHTLNDVWFKE